LKRGEKKRKKVGQFFNLGQKRGPDGGRQPLEEGKKPGSMNPTPFLKTLVKEIKRGVFQETFTFVPPPEFDKKSERG